MGGKSHPKLNTDERPIANKYCEGKMKSTLKKELKAREIVKREPIEGSSASPALNPALVCAAAGNSASDPAAEPGRGPDALAGVFGQVNIGWPGASRGTGR